MKSQFLRLVFTSNRVVVGVIIRSTEQYNLVKIKPTESETEHWFCLWLHCLWSSENSIAGVASRRINQWQYSILGLAIGCFFCFRLPTTQFSLDHKQRSLKWNGKRSNSSNSDSVELMTLFTTLIFNFHYVISSLMTQTMPQTMPPTLSLVKTSLKCWLTNKSFAQPSRKVENQACWGTDYTVGLPKQRNLHQSSLTFLCFGEQPLNIYQQIHTLIWQTASYIIQSDNLLTP